LFQQVPYEFQVLCKVTAVLFMHPRTAGGFDDQSDQPHGVKSRQLRDVR
jgi:hypothetical protein